MKCKSLQNLKNKLIYTVALCAINNISLISASAVTVPDVGDLHRHINVANRAIVQELGELADQFFTERSTLENERLSRENTRQGMEKVAREGDSLNKDHVFELFQEHALACKAVSDEQIAEMSSLKKTVADNHTAAVTGARLRGLLIDSFLQIKTDLSEQSKDFDSIRDLFMKELAALHDIDLKREKILIKYASGWTLNDPAQFLEYAGCCISEPDLNAETVWEYSLRKDVLDVMLDSLDSRQPRENNTSTFCLKITPKVLMQIYRFFEAALTLRNDSNSKSNSKTLLTTRQNEQLFQYFLFKPHHNVIEFLKENNEIIDALIKFNLWDQRLNPNDPSLFHYDYTQSVAIHRRLNLIRDQLSKAFPNQIKDTNVMNVFKNLGKMALTTSPELSLVFGELTASAEINRDILTDYLYLENLDPALYQPLIDICQLINAESDDLTNSIVFRKIRASLLYERNTLA